MLLHYVILVQNRISRHAISIDKKTIGDTVLLNEIAQSPIVPQQYNTHTFDFPDLQDTPLEFWKRLVNLASEFVKLCWHLEYSCTLANNISLSKYITNMLYIFI